LPKKAKGEKKAEDKKTDVKKDEDPKN